MSGIFRTFFITLDTIVYSILEVIFQLIIDLAHFQLFTSQTIDTFRNRIYLILGLVMFFKLIISFIQILIDPNKFDDKEQGLTGIIRRVIISMILIVIVPSIFELSRRLQDYIIPIIPKVILGVEADLTDENNPDNEDVTSSSGRIMAYYSFLPFFYYYDGCENGHLAGFGNNDQATIFSVPQAAAEVNLKDCPSTPDANGYTYRYQMFISTIVGAYLVYVLVTVALKIAIRAIKLSLCEIIAPIPIASYIDPKQSKESFDKWVQTSVKVYIDLFTRLVVVYFIIYIFQLLFNSDGGSKFQETIGQYGFIRGSLVILFIIVGLLQFAKEMPKFVSDMLGVKDGFSDIGDMFKGQGFRAIGTTVGGAAGMITQPIGAAAAAVQHAWARGERGRVIARAIGAFGAGFGRSANAFVNNKGLQGTVDARHTTVDNARRHINASQMRRDAYGKGIQGALNFSRARGKDNFYEFIGTPIADSKSYHAAGSMMTKAKSQIFDKAKTKVIEKPTLVSDDLDLKNAEGKVLTDSTGKAIQAKFSDVYSAYKQASATGAAVQIGGKGKAYSFSDLETIYGNALKDAAEIYVDNVDKGVTGFENVTMKTDIDQFRKDLAVKTVIDKTDRDDVNNAMAKGAGNFFKKSDEFGSRFEEHANDLELTEMAKKGDKSN